MLGRFNSLLSEVDVITLRGSTP